MNAIIEKYCNKNKGLFLLDSPTGFGKTYSVVEYIFNLFNSGSDRKIFFITNLKNNLPIKEIKERFNSSSKNMNFENKFIFLRPYYEEVIDVLKNENIVKEIPSEILLTEEYKEIKKKVDLLTTLDLNKDLINAFLDEIREKHEPLFREKIKKYILNNFKSKKEALNKIKRNENNKWNWLIKLYPCVLLKEKQIFFMSVDKFIKPVSNLIEESFYFYNSDFINDSLIFIDEFDSSKDAILNSIIDEGINEKIEFISLFLKIYNNLTNHSYPNYIVKKASSFNSDKAIKTTTDLKDIIKEFKNIADKIFKDFHLEYSIKNKEINTQSKNNFLFQDIEFITILNDEKKYIYLETNRIEKMNYICSINKDDLKENNKNNKLNFDIKKYKTLRELFSRIRGFISYFSKGVSILSYNYVQLKKEQKEQKNNKNKNNYFEDDFTYEEAVRTILSDFGVEENKEHAKFLFDNVISYKEKGKKEKFISKKDSYLEINDTDNTFYNDGFRYFSIEDNNNHDLKSNIELFLFENTPEKILLSMCLRARVIGISATSTLMSVLGNYDLDYIRRNLDNKIDLLNEEENEYLKEKFDEQNKNYKKININVESIDGEIKNNFENDSFNLSLVLKQKIDLKIANKLDNNEFLFKRYIRVLTVFKSFLLNTDTYSFLCLMNTLPKNNDEFNFELIKDLFKLISQSYNIEFNVDKNVFILKSNNFEDDFKEIKKLLENGEKVFVFSTYQSVGIGQNLIYKAQENIKNNLIKINEFRENGNKDFDAIYLEKPSYLISPLINDVDINEGIRLIYQLEALKETGEISKLTFLFYIEKVFKKFMGLNSFKSNKGENIRKKTSFTLYLTKIFIQAIGRICRTNLKSRNINIYIHDEFLKSLDKSLFNKRILNVEAKKVIEKVDSLNIKSEEEVRLINKGINNNSKAYNYIKSFLNNSWTLRTMNSWKELREFVLKKPTIESINFNDNIFNNFYVELLNENNELYFECEDSDKMLIKNISFKKDKNNQFPVSLENSRLPYFLNIKGFKKYMEDNNYATEFKKAKYIISPIIFQNIYKGALGELVGKYLIENKIYKGILEDITDTETFEFFDFKIKDKPIYVDLKNWSGSIDLNKEETLTHIVKKAESCKAKVVYIFNIFNEDEKKKIVKQTINGITIKRIYSLLDKNFEMDKDIFNELYNDLF